MMKPDTPKFALVPVEPTEEPGCISREAKDAIDICQKEKEKLTREIVRRKS